MNIGIVCYPTFGGSGVLATELGMALADKGHEVHFITYNQPVRLDFLSHNLHFHEVVLEEYPLFQYQPYELALSSKIVEVALAHQLEVLHVHYAIPHAYAAFMAKKMLKEKEINIKVVTTLHGTDITLVGSHPTYKTAVEFSINNSDEVTAVSNSLKEDTLRLFKIKKDIKVIYNFIDAEKYSKAIENCTGNFITQNDEKVLTHVSNFRPVKRVADVVRIFNKVQQQVPSKLLMVGDGPDRLKAENLCRALNISDKVIFMGSSNEVPKILCYTDVFVLPSETESFGLAALEAMAAGSVVISSNTGGLPEVNIHNKTGFLSNLGEVEDMAKNVIKVLQDETLLSTMKENAKKHVEKFSLESILAQYEVIYKACF